MEPSLRNYSLKQINNLYTHIYLIYMSVYLFAPSREQPLCFSLWINNSATLGKIKTVQLNELIIKKNVSVNKMVFTLKLIKKMRTT